MRRVERRRGVLQTQAHAGELHLDLVDGLLSEIPYIEQVGLGAADQLPDRVDALALEAVVRADGEVQLLDRQRQVGSELRVLRRRADVDAPAPFLAVARPALETHTHWP